MWKYCVILISLFCFNLFGASPSFQQVTNIADGEILNATNGFITLTGATNVASALTNGLATTNYVNTITNGLATTNFVTGQGYVTATVTNGLATTNYVITATNNFGNAVAVTMTNAANQFNGSYALDSGWILFAADTNTIYIQNTLKSGLGFTMTDFASLGFPWISLGYSGNGNVSYPFYFSSGVILPDGSRAASSNQVNTATNNILATANANILSATNTFKSTVTNIAGSLTNGFINLASATNVASALTNGLATTNYVNAITNGLATTNWVKTYADTNGAGIAAALAATNGLAIPTTNQFVTATITNGLATTNYVIAATNNLGNSVAVNMTNAANQFTGNFTGVFGTLVTSNSVTTNTAFIYVGGQPYSVSGGFSPSYGFESEIQDVNPFAIFTNANSLCWISTYYAGGCQAGSWGGITNINGMFESVKWCQQSSSLYCYASNSVGFISTNWIYTGIGGGSVGAATTNAFTYYPTTTNITTVGNGIGITNIPTSSVSNFLGAVTNVASTYGGISLSQATNVAGSLTNGFINLATATNVATASALAATNAFALGELNTATNNLLSTANVGIASATNNALATASNSFLSASLPVLTNNGSGYMLGSLTVTNETNTSLAVGQIPIVGTGGQIQGTANLSYSTNNNTLQIGGGVTNIYEPFTSSNAVNIWGSWHWNSTSNSADKTANGVSSLFINTNVFAQPGKTYQVTIVYSVPTAYIWPNFGGTAGISFGASYPPSSGTNVQNITAVNTNNFSISQQNGSRGQIFLVQVVELGNINVGNINISELGSGVVLASGGALSTTPNLQFTNGALSVVGSGTSSNVVIVTGATGAAGQANTQAAVQGQSMALTTGAGGSGNGASATNGAPAGDFNFITGAGGTGGLTGGRGGNFNVTGGTGGYGFGGYVTNQGQGGSINLNGGVGVSGASAGSPGGDVTIQSGQGAAGIGITGAGGKMTLSAGIGGTVTGITTKSSPGGMFTLSGGQGGTNSYGGPGAIGGDGSSAVFQGGNGGIATVSASGTGGNGGNIYVTGGAGGAGTVVNGTPGNLYLGAGTNLVAQGLVYILPSVTARNSVTVINTNTSGYFIGNGGGLTNFNTAYTTNTIYTISGSSVAALTALGIVVVTNNVVTTRTP